MSTPEEEDRCTALLYMTRNGTNCDDGAQNASRENISTELISIIKEEAVTIIMVTHSIEEAALLSDEVLVTGLAPIKVIKSFLLYYLVKTLICCWKNNFERVNGTLEKARF